MMGFKLTQRDQDRLDAVDEGLAKVIRRAADISTVKFCVTEGLRTLEKQRELYAQGRTKPGKIVTWTLNSEHLSGRAVDLAVIGEDGKISWDEKRYPALAEIVKRAATDLQVEIEWGGDWKTKDLPHYQLKKRK